MNRESKMSNVFARARAGSSDSPSPLQTALQTLPPRGSPPSQTPTSTLEIPLPTGVVEDADIIPVIRKTGKTFHMPDGQIVEKMTDGSYQPVRPRNMMPDDTDYIQLSQMAKKEIECNIIVIARKIGMNSGVYQCARVVI
jgi:hypothetical protein